MAVVAYVVIVWLLACRELPRGHPTQPDIVLISIDSLRPDHLGAYGYDRDTSPALDGLAKRGQRFTQAMSASPWTLPAHMTMLTGLWPTDHQVIEDDRKLADTVPLITERLRDGGYATAGLVSAIYVGGDYGFSRGFDTWKDYGLTERKSLGHAVRTPELVSDAMAWVKALPEGQPAFLFMHTYDVHYPYAPPPPYNERYNPVVRKSELAYRTWHHYKENPLTERHMQRLKGQYDESIRFVDDTLAPMIELWEDDRDVVFVIVADHGEEFGERGSWGHAHTLYAEALDIPLIVSGTGITPAVRDELVGNIDIAATLAAIAGVPWDVGPGRDLRAPMPARPYLSETSRFGSNKLGVREGGVATIADLAAQTTERFELGADPGMKIPLPGDVAAVAAHLREDWVLTEGLVSGGALFQGGKRAEAAVPGRFAVWPPDSPLSLTIGEGVLPALNGSLDPTVRPGLRFDGPLTAAPRTMSDAVRAQLEALGYEQ